MDCKGARVNNPNNLFLVKTIGGARFYVKAGTMAAALRAHVKSRPRTLEGSDELVLSIKWLGPIQTAGSIDETTASDYMGRA